MYTQGQEYQPYPSTTSTTTSQYQYQYQMPTTTQTTTTTTQYVNQPVTYTTQQEYTIPGQSNYTVSGIQNYQNVVIPGTTQTVQTVSTPSVVTTQSAPGMQNITGPLKPKPVFKLLRQGSGISPNEQQGIVGTAMMVYQYDFEPISNNTASRIKKTLGGDWLVIVYNQGKPVDFNMTCVQGNDYMYFTLDNMAYQVCRLR